VDDCDACIREDAAAFAEAVIELLLDRTRRERIAAEARRTVEQRFSWDAIADTAFASYERLW
jgi:glycosyltransferase involved in cell wall biosynthesis